MSCDVQPYGRNVARQSTLVSEHATAADAFAALDAVTERMVRTGVRPDYLEFVVVNASGERVKRPGAH